MGNIPTVDDVQSKGRDGRDGRDFSEFAAAFETSVKKNDCVVLCFDPDADGYTSAIALADAIEIWARLVETPKRTILLPLPNGEGNKLNEDGKGPLNSFLKKQGENTTVVFLDVSPMDLANKQRIVPAWCENDNCFIIDEHKKDGDTDFRTTEHLLDGMYRDIKPPPGAFVDNKERKLSTAGLVWFLVKHLQERVLPDFPTIGLSTLAIFCKEAEHWRDIYKVLLSIACYADSGYQQWVEIKVKNGLNTRVPMLPMTGSEDALECFEGLASDNKFFLMSYIGVFRLARKGGQPLEPIKNPRILEQIPDNNDDWWSQWKTDGATALADFNTIGEWWQEQFMKGQHWIKLAEGDIHDTMKYGSRNPAQPEEMSYTSTPYCEPPHLWERGEINAYMFDLRAAVSGLSHDRLDECMFVYNTQYLPFLTTLRPLIDQMRARSNVVASDVFQDNNELNGNLKDCDVFFVFPGGTIGDEFVPTACSVMRNAQMAGANSSIQIKERMMKRRRLLGRVAEAYLSQRASLIRVVLRYV